MKKLLILFAVFALAVSMAACGNAGNENNTEQTQPPIPEITENESNSEDIADGESLTGNNTENSTGQEAHILVAYFSRVGNTEWENGVDAVASASLNIENGEYVGNAEILAKMVQEATGGELFFIQTEKTYPSDYRETTDEAKAEQNNDARPELSAHVDNMDKYDTVILVYPNWWGTLPMPLFTFLEEYDFSGKTILPLCTHGGSRMGSSESDIRKLCPNAILLDGLAVSGSSVSSARSDVEEWLEKSGILK